MATIREELNRWREEDTDADTHITDSDMDILESIICNMMRENSQKWITILKEIGCLK